MGRQDFINVIGLLARNEYLNRKMWILPSVCIAQAALESGFNLHAETLFGIKGAGALLVTEEYYDGSFVQVKDCFRTYPNVAAAVKGYYDFLAMTPRYARALNERNYVKAAEGLIDTTDGAPYATDPDYVEKIVNLIHIYELAAWDRKDCVYGNIDYDAVYDRNYYFKNYADLQAAFGNNPDALIQHFATYGIHEGRQACEEFNVYIYRNNYEDLRDAFGEDLAFYYLHYVNYGKMEGRTAI